MTKKVSKTKSDSGSQDTKQIRRVATFGIIMLIYGAVALAVANIFRSSGDDIFKTSNNKLSQAVEYCNSAYPDRGEPVQAHYHYKDYEEYKAAVKARATFGSLELVDNGDALIFHSTSEDYSDKETCLYKKVGLPENIKSSINHTTAADGTRQDEWDNFKIEWSYRNKETHIIIRLK